MHPKIALVCLVLSFGFFTGVSAQNATVSTAKTAKEVATLLTQPTTTSTTTQDWTIFHDEENNFYYIDFETFKVNISDIVIKDEANKVVFEEDVFDLPVNTIYELDMNNFEAGKYRIELRTFTNIIAKQIELK